LDDVKPVHRDNNTERQRASLLSYWSRGQPVLHLSEVVKRQPDRVSGWRKSRLPLRHSPASRSETTSCPDPAGIQFHLHSAPPTGEPASL